MLQICILIKFNLAFIRRSLQDIKPQDLKNKIESDNLSQREQTYLFLLYEKERKAAVVKKIKLNMNCIERKDLQIDLLRKTIAIKNILINKNSTSNKNIIIKDIRKIMNEKKSLIEKIKELYYKKLQLDEEQCLEEKYVKDILKELKHIKKSDNETLLETLKEMAAERDNQIEEIENQIKEKNSILKQMETNTENLV